MSRKMTTRYYKSGKDVVEISVLKKPDRYGFVGWIEHHGSGKGALIWVDDERLARLNVRHGYITWPDDPANPIIVIEKEMFVDYMRNGIDGLVLLFHEFGHFMLGHLLEQTTVDGESDYRKELVDRGEVSQAEVDADAFAAAYIGGDTVYWSLQDSMDGRITWGLFGELDEMDRVAIEEYRIRIEAIAEAYDLNDDEEEDE